MSLTDRDWIRSEALFTIRLLGLRTKPMYVANDVLLLAPARLVYRLPRLGGP